MRFISHLFTIFAVLAVLFLVKLYKPHHKNERWYRFRCTTKYGWTWRQETAIADEGVRCVDDKFQPTAEFYIERDPAVLEELSACCSTPK